MLDMRYDFLPWQNNFILSSFVTVPIYKINPLVAEVGRLVVIYKHYMGNLFICSCLTW